MHVRHTNYQHAYKVFEYEPHINIEERQYLNCVKTYVLTTARMLE